MGSSGAGYEAAGAGGELFNVVQYGADPTGAVASDSAVDAAIAAASSGGVIFFPPGRYVLNNTHVMQSAVATNPYGIVSLRGEEGTIIVPGIAPVFTWNVDATSVILGVSVGHLDFELASDLWWDDGLVRMQGCRHFRVERLRLFGGASGARDTRSGMLLNLANSYEGTIANCVAYGRYTLLSDLNSTVRSTEQIDSVVWDRCDCYSTVGVICRSSTGDFNNLFFNNFKHVVTSSNNDKQPTQITTLASTASSGATSISVNSSTGLAVADYIWIGSGATAEIKHIASITGTGPFTITFDSIANITTGTLANTQASGANVRLYRTTVLTNAASAGASSIVVDSVSAVAANCVLLIDTGSVAELAKVASIAGSTLTLSHPLRFAHSAGAQAARGGVGVSLSTNTFSVKFTPAHFEFGECGILLSGTRQVFVDSPFSSAIDVIRVAGDGTQEVELRGGSITGNATLDLGNGLHIGPFGNTGSNSGRLTTTYSVQPLSGGVPSSTLVGLLLTSRNRPITANVVRTSGNPSTEWHYPSGSTGLHRQVKIAGVAKVTENMEGSVTYASTVSVGGTAATIFSGTGTPEAAVTAPVGSIFLRTDGGAATSLYVKETGSGNTGWVGK